MLSAKFLLDARRQFAITGPAISEVEIAELFPASFPGQEDLVQFYLNTNGGSRTEQGCVIHCGNPAHRVSKDRMHELRIEGFLSLSRDAADRMLPFASMLRHYNSALRVFDQIPKVKTFLEQNRPIAFDHSGNDIWIDLQSGFVRFRDSAVYQDDPVEIAGSFCDFVTRYWIDPILPALT